MNDRLRLLYVDDEADIHEVVQFVLEDEADIELRSCLSGAEALRQATAAPPDLILLDVMMPDLDGPTLLLQLRERGVACPVVFITAKVQTRDVERLLALGAVGVIAKPFDPMQLAEQIRLFAPRRRSD